MPKARQHILSECPVRQYRTTEGRPITREEIERFLTSYETLDRVEGTFQFYRQKELLSFANKKGIRSGPVFITRNGRPISRTNICAMTKKVCGAARLTDERATPRGLRKLYQSTRATVESNIALLVEQAMERQLEQEQFSIGWEEG